MAESFPGNLNQSEVDLIKKAGPNLLVSQKGLNLLNKVFSAANDRAQAEAEYATEFNLNDTYKSLGARELHAEFNKGLKQIRIDNPVITPELRTEIEGAISDRSGAGDFTVQLPGGGTQTLDTNQQLVFNAIKGSSSEQDWLAKWEDFKQANPQFKNMDPSSLWSNYSRVTRVQNQ